MLLFCMFVMADSQHCIRNISCRWGLPGPTPEPLSTTALYRDERNQLVETLLCSFLSVPIEFLLCPCQAFPSHGMGPPLWMSSLAM